MSAFGGKADIRHGLGTNPVSLPPWPKGHCTAKSSAGARYSAITTFILNNERMATRARPRVAQNIHVRVRYVLPVATRHRGCSPPLTAFSVADTNARTNTDKK